MADPFAGAVSTTIGAVVSVALAAVTVRVNAVVRVTPETLPLTVIVHVPRGVDADVSMMTSVVHVGAQDASEKVALAPGGSPNAVKCTIFVEPSVKITAIGFDTDDPRATERLPPFAKTKLKDPVPDSAFTSGSRTPRAASIKNVRR
jgi:hypothetical protein